MDHVNLENVGKSFGKVEVLKDICLSIEEGEFCALLGPSGCGKSTLLRIIAGLETPTLGRVVINGRDVTPVPPSKRKIAMVFQSYALYPHMTVRDNISFSMEIAGLPKDQREANTRKVAEMLQLSDLLDRKPAQLSGGQRQRVAIGRALVREPEVFLFDEPLSNLDAKLRVQMRVELEQLHRQLDKTTMIYVTHDQVEAMTLADRIVVLDSGKISQAGTPLSLYNAPDNRFVAAFIGSPAMNFLQVSDVTENGETFSLRLRKQGTLTFRPNRPDRSGRPVEIGVRPEHVSLVARDHATASSWGEVHIIERLGNLTVTHVTTPGGTIVVEGPGDVDVNYGETVGLAMRADKIHAFTAEGDAL